MKSDDFCHLHLHSDYSQLDGLGKVSEYVELAAKRGSPAIAFTDHGTMRGYLQQHTQCEKHNVKPIYGTEFYVSPDMRRRGLSDDEKAFITKDLPRKDHRKAIEKHEEQIGLRDRWHITVWAYSQQGLQNLYRLSSAAWIEGFYYKARIDLSALIEHGEGLMVSTGCLASPIHEQWREGKKKAALEFADRLHDAFGDRLWLEIQPHNIKIQRLANLLCTKLRDRYPKSRLLATQDAHYVRQGDAPHHDCLLCIGTNAQIDDQERFRFDGDEFFFKSRRQMRESFERAHPGLNDKQVTEALNSTLVFAERCSAVVEVDYKKALLPDPGIPEEYGGDTFKFLKTLCLDGWSWRNIKARAERYAMANSLDVPHAIAIYRDRLLAELKLIRAMKFERYFVMVFDIYREARKRKIFVGPGRGSVGGSLAAYLLGIHSVDPIQHGLLFERFINPDRKDLPDIDMDFEDSRRGEMIEYMRNKYGTENVCQISTIGKLSGKSCFKDVCRVVGVPYTLANSLTASIIHRNPHEEREFNCIEDSFGQENLKAFDKKFPAVKLHGMAIEGTAKTLGIHAAGLIASPVPLRDITPLEVRNSGGEKTVVCALDMNDAAKIGLVKLDFLGLKTLTVIRKCLEAIKERHGKAYDLESEEFDIDDPKVLKAFTDHDYIGVFQYDSPSADQVCKGVTFDRFADVPTMTALNRPGTTDSGMDEQFRKRKADPKLLKKHDFHPIVSNIAKDTLGVLCYQEHLIEIFKQVGGMTPGEADSLRRAVGKKLAKEEIEKYREGFVKGADKVGVSADIAGRLMDAIVKFANYGFNKCVSGDTQLWRAGVNESRDTGWTIREYYEKKSENSDWGKKFRSGKCRILQMDEDGRVRPGYVKDIHYNGVRAVFWVKTWTGRSIKVTSNHRLMTENGYRRVSSLRPGDRLVCCSGERDSYKLKGNQTERAKGKTYEGSGTPSGSDNPSWIDGRTVAFQDAKDRVAERANGKCESCSAKWEVGESFEFAHLRSLEDCSGDYSIYHSEANLSLLCNSCHKCLDYQKGERKAAWSKGRSTVLDTIGEIQELPPEMVFDVEMATEGHNYVANGIVSHNSHATEYGLIGYWCMWLKTYYPLEFFWALLWAESDTDKIKKYAVEAKRREIAVLPAHVNTSGAKFTINGEEIWGSLVDIKGVGDKAAEDIQAKAPFKSFVDFVVRIDRRRCNRGAVVALVRAGAFFGMVNVRWLIENMDDFWKQLAKAVGKKGDAQAAAIEALEDLVEAGKKEPEYDQEELKLIQAEQNPLAFMNHPMDAYKSFIKREIKVNTVKMDGDFFEELDGKGIYISGIITGVRKHQVGDYGDREKDHPDFGKPYANVNIQDSTGTERRVKFAPHVYAEHQAAIDAGAGKPLLIHCSPNLEFESIRGNFAVNLQALRMKLKAGQELSIWEQIVTGRHPASVREWSSEAVKLQHTENRGFFKGDISRFTGVVTHIQRHTDKKGRKMAYLGLLDARGHYVRAIAFADAWRSIRRVVKTGLLLRAPLSARREGKGVTAIFEHGKVTCYGSRV